MDLITGLGKAWKVIVENYFKYWNQKMNNSIDRINIDRKNGKNKVSMYKRLFPVSSNFYSSKKKIITDVAGWFY